MCEYDVPVSAVPFILAIVIAACCIVSYAVMVQFGVA